MEFVIIILLLVVIAMLLCLYFSSSHDVIISDESLVIGFVGILATFIVIGNAQQVREIRNDMHDELREWKDDEKEKRKELFNSVKTELTQYNEKYQCVEKQLKEINSEILNQSQQNSKQDTSLLQAIENISELKKQNENLQREFLDNIDTLKSDVDKKYSDFYISNSGHINRLMSEYLKTILLIIDTHESKFIFSLFYDENCCYDVKTIDGRFKAKKKFENEINFYDIDTDSLIKDLIEVNDYRYDAEYINGIYKKLMELIQAGEVETSSIILDNAQIEGSV